ncbi:N-acetylmuramoyl-L-alanine amidase [Paenibacillus cymbidii]|uniref:N-acetylmuramoyl-L-alanine amidase n=1 Tax=Paenibacillus cymbidii TaxID=1639034 RepID=UPI0010816F22|nr:N-acetylmuramoyl-L-alanine amidase [Paenibacillus cymbidii]
MKKWLQLTAVALLCAFVFPYPASAVKIVVDAGHGGYDPGAIGVGGLQEKTVNLDISLKLRDELQRRGYMVAMTREDDRFIALPDRVSFTNGQNADLFVSVHANSYPNASMTGSMVLYYDDDYPQADYPASEAMRALSAVNRAFATQMLQSFLAGTGLGNKGIVPSAVHVVRMGTIPSVLVETAFLSNPAEAALLAIPEKRTSMALAIADGIEAFRPPIFPDLGQHWAQQAVMRLYALGYVQGANNLFYPNQPLTRAELVTMLGRVFAGTPGAVDTAIVPCATAQTPAAGSGVTAAVYGTGGKEPICNVPVFRDLAATHWAYDAMRQAAASGWLQGYPDGTIRPNAPVTREESAVLLDRLLQLAIPASGSAATGKLPFTDVAPTAWSASAIARLAAAGIVQGASNDKFAPQRQVTRAEMSVMLDRYVNAAKDAG